MKFQFEIPTEEEARTLLRPADPKNGVPAGRSYQAESYKDAIACGRRLMPVTSEHERATVARYREAVARWHAGEGPYPYP